MSRKLFAGIAIPKSKVETLEQSLARLKRTAHEREFQIQWVPKANWHITLWYFGPSTVEEEKTISERLLSLAQEQRAAIDLDVRGFGAFPEPTHARVFWAGVSRTRELVELYDRGVAKFSSSVNDMTPTNRDEDLGLFAPHLTLARFRNLQSASPLIEPFARKRLFSFRVDEIILFESALEGHYPKYTPLTRFAFAPK